MGTIGGGLRHGSTDISAGKIRTSAGEKRGSGGEKNDSCREKSDPSSEKNGSGEKNYSSDGGFDSERECRGFILTIILNTPTLMPIAAAAWEYEATT